MEMILEAGKEINKRRVLIWLYEVYVTPSRVFNEYTESELKMFAHNALSLLKDQPEIVRCKDCKHATMTEDGKLCKYCAMNTDEVGDPRDVYHDADWFCADVEKRDSDG